MKLSGTLITIAVIIFIPILLLGLAIIHYYSNRTIKMDKCSNTKADTKSASVKPESDEFLSIFDEEGRYDE